MQEVTTRSSSDLILTAHFISVVKHKHRKRALQLNLLCRDSLIENLIYICIIIIIILAFKKYSQIKTDVKKNQCVWNVCQKLCLKMILSCYFIVFTFRSLWFSIKRSVYSLKWLHWDSAPVPQRTLHRWVNMQIKSTSTASDSSCSPSALTQTLLALPLYYIC